MKRHDFYLLFVLVFSWSMFFVFNKIIMKGMGSPFLSSFIIRLVNMFFLVLYFIISKKIYELKTVKGNILSVVFVVLLVFCFDIFANIGFMYSNISTGTVLLKTEIVFVCIFSSVITHEKHKAIEWLIVFFMLIGVIITLDINLCDLSFNIFDMLFVLSAIINALCSFLIKWLQQSKGISPNALVLCSNGIALFSYFLVCLVLYGKSFSIIDKVDPIQLSNFVFVAIMAGLLQFTQMMTYYNSIQRLKVWLVKSITLLVPVISSVIGFLFLREQITSLSIFGMIIVISSSLALLFIESKKKPN